MAIDLSSPARCTSFKTRQFARVIARHYDAELASTGLKSTQYSLLTHVLNRGPLSTKDLARRMGLDISSLTRNLKPLMDSGWIQQTIGTDARTRCVSITPQGERMQQRGHVRWQVAQQEINEVMGVDRALELHALIDACMEKLKNVRQQCKLPS